MTASLNKINMLLSTLTILRKILYEMENCVLIITLQPTWHKYGYHAAFHFTHVFPEDGRSRLKRVGVDVWMNRVLLKAVCKACCVYFIIVNYTLSWTVLGPVCTLHNTFVRSDIKRSAHNGFVCFMWSPERLFSYTALTDCFLLPEQSVFTARYELNYEICSRLIFSFNL